MTSNPKLQSTSTFSDAEWQARIDLAACYRLMDHYGMTDMAANHISYRVPGQGEVFLINPYGLLYTEITASSLIKIDLEGNVLYNPWSEYSANRAGFVIHSALHASNPRIACVVHTHTPDGMAVSALRAGLLPLTQTAMRFGKVAYHDYEGVAVDDDEKARLVADMGDSEVMILRNHGLLAVGASVPQAFNNIYRLERACITQVKAMSCGAELVIPPEPVVQRTNAQLVLQPSISGTVKRPHGELEWPALLRMLDAKDRSYRE